MSAVTSAPTVAELAAAVAGTPTGRRLLEEEAARKRGEGAPHTDAKLRLFGKSESDVRVTLYRDTAAWCPYCQKVWLLLEEKQVPYKVTKINMRSYGDKPAEYLRKVPNGLLPALEIDGQFMTDSIPIMLTIDAEFADHGPRMVPAAGSADRARADGLLRLERELFRDWCSLTFQPGTGMFGSNKKAFQETLRKVDSALGDTPGPWFLGGPAPSLVDLQYVSHVERMVASLAYWKVRIAVPFLARRRASLPHRERRTPPCCTSAASWPYLGCISAVSRLYRAAPFRPAARHAHVATPTPDSLAPHFPPPAVPWQGMRLRDASEYPHLCAWLDAFEARPSYLATKSDMYSHVTDIPPQVTVRPAKSPPQCCQPTSPSPPVGIITCGYPRHLFSPRYSAATQAPFLFRVTKENRRKGHPFTPK
jgi:glutathione S-transferase